MQAKTVTELFKKYSGEHKEFLEPLTMLTHSEFIETVNGLKRDNKIAEDAKGHLCWIYDPNAVRVLINSPTKYPPVK